MPETRRDLINGIAGAQDRIQWNRKRIREIKEKIAKDERYIEVNEAAIAELDAQPSNA